jgi:hypothetical protein
MALQCITCDFSTFGVFGSYYIDNIHPQHARTCIHTYIYDGCSCFFFLLLSLLLQIFFLFFLSLGERERESEEGGKTVVMLSFHRAMSSPKLSTQPPEWP